MEIHNTTYNLEDSDTQLIEKVINAASILTLACFLAHVTAISSSPISPHISTDSVPIQRKR
jgi:hypothetical protein